MAKVDQAEEAPEPEVQPAVSREEQPRCPGVPRGKPVLRIPPETHTGGRRS